MKKALNILDNLTMDLEYLGLGHNNLGDPKFPLRKNDLVKMIGKTV